MAAAPQHPDRRRWLQRAAGLGLAWTGAALGLAGCGGGTDRTKALLRFVNASAYVDGLDLTIDGEPRLATVGYGADTGYIEVDPGAAESRLQRSGSPTTLLGFTPALAEDRHFTLLAWGDELDLEVLLIDDEQGEPDAGRSVLRVVNAGRAGERLDIYVTAAGEDLARAVPTHAGVEVGALADAVTLDSGTWRVAVMAAGSKTDVRLDVAAVTLDSGGVATLVVVPGRGGMLVDALLLRQQGAVVRLDNAEARVAVVAARAIGGTVDVEVGGLRLANALASPAATRYQRVPAGTQPVRIRVDGGTDATSERLLEAGRDYTLVVDEDGAPGFWLVDDNRAPGSGVALRLVHAVAPAGAVERSATLTAAGLVVAAGVARGQASAYETLVVAGSVDLQVVASGATEPWFSAVDQVLALRGVYTVFVTGRDGATRGIVRNDRG